MVTMICLAVNLVDLEMHLFASVTQGACNIMFKGKVKWVSYQEDFSDQPMWVQVLTLDCFVVAKGPC